MDETKKQKIFKIFVKSDYFEEYHIEAEDIHEANSKMAKIIEKNGWSESFPDGARDSFHGDEFTLLSDETQEVL